VIGAVLQDPAILAENVYNMDETGVVLSMPGSVKVLVVTQPRGFWKRRPSGKSTGYITGYIFMLTPGPLYKIEIIIKIYILVSNLPFTQTLLRILKVVDLEVTYPDLASSNADADSFP
jgi:hypothetical protein